MNEFAFLLKTLMMLECENQWEKFVCNYSKTAANSLVSFPFPEETAIRDCPFDFQWQTLIVPSIHFRVYAHKYILNLIRFILGNLFGNITYPLPNRTSRRKCKS